MSKNQPFTHIEATKKLNLDADSKFPGRKSCRDKIEFQFAVPNVRRTNSLVKGVPLSRGKQHSADENGRQLCQANFDNFFLLRISLGRSYLRDAPAPGVSTNVRRRIVRAAEDKRDPRLYPAILAMA